MALINCHECNGEISTLAKSCPKCGAPGPASDQAHVPSKNQRAVEIDQCPFCKSEVNEAAIVCPSCHARKGYLNVFWPIEIGVVGEVGAYIFMGALLLASITPLFVFSVPLLIYAFYRYKKGPYWYQSRSPAN